MRWADPMILQWLWTVIIFGAFVFWSRGHRQRALKRFASRDLLDELTATYSVRQAMIKDVLLGMVLVLSIIALARPQWGFELREVKRQGLDIILVMDTSKSMLTQDVRPNRLERTKLAARDLVQRLQGDRVGLVAFAGDAFLICPLTVDYGAFLMTLDNIDVNTISRGGTNLAAAIQAAIKEYDNIPGKYKAVIVLTDGENLEGDPLALARKAKEKGIKVYCVGIGTGEGDLIQVSDAAGKKEFLKDAGGNFVKSRLNEQLLQKIALSTGGIYVRASGAQFGLDLIYQQELAKFEKRDIKSQMEKKYYERFQIPLAIALVLLVMETALSARVIKGKT